MTSAGLRPGETPREQVTQLLNELGTGRAAAADRLVPLVYDELRRMASHKLSFERRGHTLDTTALVHEAWMRLVRQEDVRWNSRTHFYAIAAQAMRRILVNHAVKRKAEKRGGGAVKVPLDEMLDSGIGPFSDERIDEILTVHRALEELQTFNERGSRVVEYRFFGGMTYEEIAEVMGISQITVRRAWTGARLWLARRIGRDEEG